MKRSIFTLFFAILANVFAFSAKSFVGFDASSVSLGTQIYEQNLIQNQSNVTLVETDESSHKYNINLTDAGEGSFTMGGVTFALTGSAGQTAFKTYNTYIQSNGSSREVRIPTIAGERVKVVLTEACAGIAVNGVSQDFVAGENILTATGSSITLVNSSAKPKYQAILSLGTPAPTVQDLADAGYNVTSKVVVCLSFDVNPCNGVVYTGSFNNWSTDLANCLPMAAVPNFNGWYAVEFSAEKDTWNNDPSGKPIAIPNDGQFSWETQPGKSDAWEHIDGKAAQITNSGELESNVSYPSAGAYIYNIKYWKDHTDPCRVINKHEYTLNFYAPYLCDTLTPAVVGTFNAWTPAAMTLTTDGENRPMYTITFEAEEGERFSIRATNNFENFRLKQYNDWYGEWQDYPEYVLATAYTITLDCSDATRYRMGDCKMPISVTVFVPSDCGLDTTNGLWLNYRSADDYGDGERIAMTSIGGHKFTASFTISSNYYEVYALNSETMTEGTQRSYNYNSDEQTICFEASPVESNNRFSISQVDCSQMVDHNYMPYNLTATPLTRDSILFEWQMVDAIENTYFYIRCYDANDQTLFSEWRTTSDQRSMRVKAGTATAVNVAYWTIEITNQESSISYKARGEGFTVQGDDRLPHNITFTNNGGDLFTMNWEGGNDIHHYSLYINDYEHDEIFTDVTTTSYQLNLAGATYVYITITAKNANNEELGSIEAERIIYTIKFYAPTLCDDIIPALSGTFNNQGTTVMTAATDENSKTYYTAKIVASNNDTYTIRGNDGTDTYALKRRNGDEWETMEPFTLNSWNTTITHDCSNISDYRMGNCLPPVLHAVTATVLVPTDCNMDTPNGLYIAWWANSNAGNVHVVPMTAGEGRKYSITFDPNDNAYGYYFCNNLDRDAEGYHQTESRNELSEASLCWEVGYNEYGGYWSSHALVPDGTCSAADHDYRPTGMQAVNSSQDTVLFSWNWLPGINNYQVLAYDADDHQLFQDYVYEYNHGDAHSHAFRNGDTLHVAYWKLVAVKRIETDGRQYYFYYPANGEGFSVAGDERIPHNLMLSEKSDGVYTLTWGGSDAVDHYRITVMESWGWEQQYYDTTALTYDLKLEDNQNYSITVSSMMSEYDVYGQASININTQKQEARDISLYFYLPESTGLMTEAGCAIVWYIPNLGGEHIIPLTADGDNGHWYKATVEQFTRQNFYFSFINAATKEAATKTLTYSESISEDKKFLIETNQKGEPVLSTSRANVLYPHDYALTGLEATQVLNKMNLSWTANENAPSYNVRIYHPNGTVQWEREVDETSVVYDGLNNSDSITLTWSVTPRGEWYTTFESLTLSGQFTAAPSPFLATNLRAVNNNDGTFTFSWSPAAHDTVKSYQLNVYDIEHETVANQYNIQDTTVTLPVQLLFSGNYMMNVVSYNYREDYLGEVVDTFAIAPIAAHDIAIRVMVNPSCGLDATDSLQLRIKRYYDNDTIVNAVKERYGWWSYTVNTDQYGVIMNIKDYYEYARIYGDTCLEYNNRWSELDCEARAGDYIPHHLAAQPNADGTYAISWMMDMTERAKYYRVQVQHRDSNWNNDGDSRIESMQYTTSRLPYSGMYYYTVSAVEDGGNVIGQAVDSFTIAPMERDIVLRVLEQPLDENWSAYLLDIYGNAYVLNVEDEENPRWCRAVIHTTDPAVHIKLKSWYNSSTEFWMYGDTCIESNNGFHEIACDAVPENFTITNAHAVSQGNGYVSFTWNCLDNPDAFYIQTIIRDSVPLTYQYLEGSARSYTTLLNVDTVEQLTWYVMTLKHRNDNYYRLTYVYGDTISIEPSAYAPKNLQYAPNSNGTYTITWNSNPDTVAQYLIQIKYPDKDDRDNFYTTDTFFITPVFPYLEAYDVYVYSLSKQNTNLGWQMVRIQVEELETPRDITIRVLLHPDAGRDNPGNLYTYNYSSRQWSGNTPTDEGGNWWSYTFSSTMPVQICNFPSLYVQDDYAYVAQDTCFEYVNELKYAACDAQPHDYRITANSFHAVSEPGKVTFTWSAAEKADEYRISADYSLHGEWWRQLFSETVNDTSFVFLVPDHLDGAVLENAYVRPMAPHSLGSTSLDSTFILHKGQITLSELQATTTDSMTFNFTWQANTDTVYYQVAFVPYDDMNAEPTHVSPILSASNYSYTFLSAANRYRYWAVRATTAQGEPLTAWFPAENPIVLQPSLRAISNVQSTVVGDTITFTWNTTAPATGCRLSYSDINNYWYEIIARDSIVLDNTFTYIATQDGRYEISLTAYSEPIPGQYQSLNEYAYGTANYFSTPTYSVQVTTTTGGQFGWGDPSGDYPEGYHVWLDVYELEHYRFVGWSDGVMENNRELIVSQDTFLIALFERRQEHTLTLYAGEGGLLHYYDPSMGEYNDTTQYQSVVEQGYGFYAEAVPSDGYAFYRWSDGYEYAGRSFDLRSDSTFTAYFLPLRYATVNAGEGGRVQVTGGEYNKSTRQYKLMEGESLILKALPDENYRFVNWSDGDVNVNRTLVVASDTVVTANFALITEPLAEYVVRILSGNTELGDVNNVSGTYHDGDQVTITALPEQNAMFTGWSDGVNEATRTITVTQDTTLTAAFDYKRFTLNISASDGGTVNDTTANGIYTYDEWVLITATPNEHYRFVEWSDGNTNASRYVQMVENVTLTATFAVEQYLVTFLNADGAYIESSWWSYGEIPVCSETPTLEPTEEYEYTFIGWTPEIVPVTGIAVYTATYEENPREPSGIDDLPVEPSDNVRKIFRNGQIFIIRGDRVYTVTGQLVK